MGKRDEQRKQADRDFEEIRQAIAAQSDDWLCDALRDIPHRKWIEIEKDTHFAVGIIAHRAAQRIAELSGRPRMETRVGCRHCGSTPLATERGRCEECGKYQTADGQEPV